jgi:RNA polymerase sigma factor (TIGR02999 family)
MSNVTQLLQAIERGERQASEELLPLVYDELRKLARDRLRHEPAGQTLQATALVHEAWMRLVDQSAAPGWEGRGHFFAAAAEAMRRILVENARRKNRLKRGGDRDREDLDEAAIAAPESDDRLLDLDRALELLQKHDPRKAQLVKLRYFAGLTLEQAATALGIGTSTADRDWAYAKAWLFREMSNA